MIIQVNFDPIQEIEPKVGGGDSFCETTVYKYHHIASFGTSFRSWPEAERARMADKGPPTSGADVLRPVCVKVMRVPSLELQNARVLHFHCKFSTF